MKNFPNITFLQYFYSAASSKSVSKAAKENFVSQSAISQAIAKLEVSLGVQLITHAKNRFQLTSEGNLLLSKCKEIFSHFTEIEDAFNLKEGIYRGKLSLACTHSFAIARLPEYLQKLANLYPDIEPVLRLGHTGVVAELVKKGEVDFGIVLDNDDFSAFHCQEIYSGQYRLYQAKKLPKQFSKRIITSEERREVVRLKEFLAKEESQIKSFIEVSSWEIIASMAEHNLGIGFLPDYIVVNRPLIPSKIRIPSIPYKILAIYPKQKKIPRNAEAFLKLLCG